MSGMLEEWKLLCIESVPWHICKYCLIKVCIFIRVVGADQMYFWLTELVVRCLITVQLCIKLSTNTCTVDITVPEYQILVNHSDVPSEGTCNLSTQWPGIGCPDAWVMYGPSWVKDTMSATSDPRCSIMSQVYHGLRGLRREATTVIQFDCGYWWCWSYVFLWLHVGQAFMWAAVIFPMSQAHPWAVLISFSYISQWGAIPDDTSGSRL